MCSERVLVYNISIGLGRVASIYHGTVRMECYQMLLLSYYNVFMRCLGDVSRGMCEVTWGFLLEFSCCCDLERDIWLIYLASKACCLNWYTNVGGLCHVSCCCDLERDIWLIYLASKACCLNWYTNAGGLCSGGPCGYLLVNSSVRSRTAVWWKPGHLEQQYGESPDIFVNTRLWVNVQRERERFRSIRPADVGRSRVTPGVSVEASLGDIGTPGAPGESTPAGRGQRVVVR